MLKYLYSIYEYYTQKAPTASMNYKYNWKRSVKKDSDKYVSFPVSDLDKSLDLTMTYKFPAIYNQGQLGSCTANSICAAYCFDVLNYETGVDFSPSRLYLYYKERELENDTPDDSGASITDGLTVLQKNGVCSETKWPYVIEKFTDKPTIDCDDEAKNHMCIDGRRVRPTLIELKNCLRNKFPFVFGFDVYESFQQLPPDFVVPMPQPNEKLLGGHAVIAVGYDDDKQLFKIRNSWGETWGDQGHFYMPYEYMTNDKLCDDFWIVSKVKDLNLFNDK